MGPEAHCFMLCGARAGILPHRYAKVAYKRIRNSVKNGLAIVPVQRGAAGGSFFSIPPQVQLEIASRNKIIID